MLLTRDALTTAVRDARTSKAPIGFPNHVIRSVREERVRADTTDADREAIRSRFGDDVAKTARIVPFTISTERRARDGHVIRASGWQLDLYRDNPIVLWAHDRDLPRIGDSVVEVVGNRLRAVAAFLPREISQLGWEVGEVAATRGIACSVGFRILRALPAGDEVLENIPWALDIDAARLDEWSPLNLGADEGALAELAGARAAGISTSAIGAALAQLLDGGALDAALRTAIERAWKVATPTTTTTSLPSLEALDASQAALRQLLRT